MEPAAFAIGGVLLALGLFSWIFRLGLLRQRAMNIPAMLFVSKEGIEAILPDTRSTTLAWEGLQATSITFFRHVSPPYTPVYIATHGASHNRAGITFSRWHHYLCGR